MYKGFSLIELLVVITVVGLLAAIAVPAYRDYATKVELAKIINKGMIIGDQLRTEYQAKGSFPTSFRYGNTTITQNSWILINDDFANYLWYRVFSPNQAAIQISLPVALLDKLIGRTDNNIGIIIYDNNQGTVSLVCSNSAGFPMRYFPPNCIQGVNLNFGPQY